MGEVNGCRTGCHPLGNDLEEVTVLAILLALCIFTCIVSEQLNRIGGISKDIEWMHRLRVLNSGKDSIQFRMVITLRTGDTSSKIERVVVAIVNPEACARRGGVGIDAGAISVYLQRRGV